MKIKYVKWKKENSVMKNIERENEVKNEVVKKENKKVQDENIEDWRKKKKRGLNREQNEKD